MKLSTIISPNKICVKTRFYIIVDSYPLLIRTSDQSILKVLDYLFIMKRRKYFIIKIQNYTPQFIVFAINIVLKILIRFLDCAYLKNRQKCVVCVVVNSCDILIKCTI